METPEIAIVGDLGDCEKEVSQALLEVPVGGECTLIFNCPGGSAYSAVSLLTLISARKLKGISDLWALGRKAKAMGYTEAEITAYVRSDAEKARMVKRGEAYMKTKGVTYDDPETFCALGRAEIEKNSAIGVYLRAK